VTQLFAERVEELFEKFHPPRSRLKPGQALWVAVAIDDPPARNKRIEDTRLVPVVLDLITPEDVDQAAGGARIATLRHNRILRLFRQAYQQKAVLSYADVSLLMHMRIGTISRYVCNHQLRTREITPCRGTIHDMGRSMTHKAIICYKRFVEKKTTSQVAAETHHDPESVEHYVQSLRRIKLCHEVGMAVDEISQATGHSVPLVREYLNLIRQFQLPDYIDSEQLPDPEKSRSTCPNAK
jgi:hypothetical protein